MAHNEEMLKNNEEKWKGRVRVVAVSLDDEQAGLVKRIEDKDWKRITHYRMKKGWDGENSTMSNFEIEGIPFVALVDQKGRITFYGHPSEVKLEEEINKLLEN